MNKTNKSNSEINKNFLNCFYLHVNGSNDGSIYANKEFHMTYYVLKHDLELGFKKIIGCLYNEYDKVFLPFRVVIKLSQELTPEYILQKVIYSENYNRDIIRKTLMQDEKTKTIFLYCENEIKKHVK